MLQIARLSTRQETFRRFLIRKRIGVASPIRERSTQLDSKVVLVRHIVLQQSAFSVVVQRSAGFSFVREVRSRRFGAGRD